MSRSQLLPPRPVLLPRPAITPPEAPPVPKRKQSLPLPSAEDGSAAAYTVSTFSSVHAMSQVETMVDDVNSTCVFEYKYLWRDAYRTLYEFYQHQQLCDVELRAGGKAFRCHRVVLACVSRYFRTMFTSEMAESRKSAISIQDIDGAAMEQLIQFAYTAKISLNTENVQSLLYAASILQVENVAQACCEFMKSHLHPNNCIGVRTFAEQHGHVDLMRKADQFTQDQFLAVVEGDEYFSMSAKHLEELLSSMNLNVVEEKQVYESVLRWVRHDSSHRHQHLHSLLSHVKLPLLPPAYLMDIVCTEELFKKDLDCRDLLDDAKNYQLSLAHVVPGMQVSDRILPRKSCAGKVTVVSSVKIIKR